MKVWTPQYKETVYCIINGTIKEEIVASGLSMSNALRIQSKGLLSPTIDDANEYLRKTHEMEEQERYL
jgi:hypothetical protein